MAGEAPRRRQIAGGTGGGDGQVVIPVLHGDPEELVEGLIWFNLDATCED